MTGAAKTNSVIFNATAIAGSETEDRQDGATAAKRISTRPSRANPRVRGP